MDDKPRVEFDSRPAWRAWLAAHHGTSKGVWLVTWKRRSGHATIPYEEAVEEALCFGWIDGQLSPVDAERSAQWFAPRRPKSTWARTNKERVARLEAAGLMAQAGLQAVARAHENGSWDLLNDIDALVVPPDLEAVLAARPGLRDRWEASSPSQRRMALSWVTQVKSAAIRATRVARVAETLAAGLAISTIWRRD
jgi:uncharacterized protein YdeI (YjbR/CyaY-like superfamily)